jgi:putative addiction module component (TIGR02574 family)
MAVEKVLQEALALPSEDRARVLEALQESLAPDDEWPDDEWEKAWAAEARRRVKDLDEGRTRAIPAEEVFAKLRAQSPPR